MAPRLLRPWSVVNSNSTRMASLNVLNYTFAIKSKI